MLDPVTLEGRHVRLEPLSVDHIPGLVQAASQSRDTYGFTYVPADADAMRLYVETALAGMEADWRRGRIRRSDRASRPAGGAANRFQCG